MAQFFNVIFYQPLFNLLVLVYNFLPGGIRDVGLVIIILTILIKLVLHPLSVKTLRSQKAMQELQPKIDEIKRKYKDQKEKQAAETMRLYKEEKINPFSSCLPLLIQLPFLIAVYAVFQAGLSNADFANTLYPFVNNPGQLNPIAFGFLDLSKKQIILALLAGAAQYWQAKMMPMKKPVINTPGSRDESMAVMMNKQMTVFMPIMTVVIGFSLPGGLMLYWLVNALLTVAQQALLFKEKKLNPQVIDAVNAKQPETENKKIV